VNVSMIANNHQVVKNILIFFANHGSTIEALVPKQAILN
jgi:hypothetical protein